MIDWQKVAQDLERENKELKKRLEQREWVGLTEGDIDEAAHRKVEGIRMLPYSFARAIEAKLKEKNYEYTGL